MSFNDATRALVMKKAFDLVAPVNDWRAPIDACVPNSELHRLKLSADDIAEAVGFYTATSAKVSSVPGGWRFKATGYRNGPAGP